MGLADLGVGAPFGGAFLGLTFQTSVGQIVKEPFRDGPGLIFDPNVPSEDIVNAGSVDQFGRIRPLQPPRFYYFGAQN